MSSEGSQEIFDSVLEYIERVDNVTFVELAREVDKFMLSKGSQSLSPSGDPKIVFWLGMSEGFACVAEKLLKSGRVHLRVTDPLTYLVDGGALTLPIAKRRPKAGYKKDHWLPVVLCAGSSSE